MKTKFKRGDLVFASDRLGRLSGMLNGLGLVVRHPDTLSPRHKYKLVYVYMFKDMEERYFYSGELQHVRTDGV